MKKILTFALLTALATSALVAEQQPAQQPAAAPPPVTFRAQANYVEVDAFVTDAQGRPVTNLTQADFEIREDGALQNVTAFSRIDLPIEQGTRRSNAPSGSGSGNDSAAADVIEADVQTNAHGEGRVYLLVLDDLNTAFTRAPRAKASIRRFIEEKLGSNDIMAIVYTGSVRDNQDFTSNRRLLLASVDKFTGHKLKSETEERLEQNKIILPASEVQGLRVSGLIGEGLPGEFDLSEGQRATRAKSVMTTVRKLATFMAGVRGRRKAMLLVGEGVDFNTEQVASNPGTGEFAVTRNARTATTAGEIRADMHEAIAAATRGNVSIYALDPRGLSAGMDDMIGAEPDRSILSTREAAAVLDGLPADSVPNTRPDKRTFAEEVRRAQATLRTLAGDTGGFAAVNQNDLSGAFDRIVAENSSYYMLGYSSGNLRRDGHFRKLDVRVKRPGVRVRSRAGYYESRSTDTAPESALTDAMASATSTAVAAALVSPLPVATLPLRMFAAPFRGEGPDPTVAVAIEVEARKVDVTLDGAGDKHLEVVFAATDNEGTIYRQDDPRPIELALTPGSSSLETTTLRALVDITLPPGRYQLRAAVGNKAGRAGSVVYDLEVPDFKKTALTMSGVAIASAWERIDVALPTIIGAVLKAPPTTVREFARGETILLFAEVYDNMPAAPAHLVDLRVELRTLDGRLVDGVAEEQSSADRKEPSAPYRFTPELPLDSDVAPGTYVLSVEAKARDAAASVVRRNIQIRIQ